MIILAPLLLSVVLSLVTFGGDILVKEASIQQGFAGWKLLIFAAIIYASTAVGWFYLMKKVNFSFLGAVYSLLIILLHVLFGVLFYKEKINTVEILGLTMAVASLVILFRFE